MTPERIAELRRLLARHRHFVDLHGGGECGIHRELRDAYDDLSHEMVKNALDLLATAEREAKLREAATAVLSRLDYLQGLWGAEGVTTRLADDLRAALEAKGGE